MIYIVCAKTEKDLISSCMRLSREIGLIHLIFLQKQGKNQCNILLKQVLLNLNNNKVTLRDERLNSE